MKTVEEAQGELLSLEALLLSRAYLYELFHKVFGGQPTSELFEALSSPIVEDVLDEYASESSTLGHLKTFARKLGEKAADAAFAHEASDELTRFFEGPTNLVAIPWESAYIGHEGMVFQASTLAVREAYAAHGLRVKHFKRMPDDHISMMCAFMANVSRSTLDAFRGREWSHMERLLKDQYAFVRDHMANWLPEYAKCARKVKTAHLYPQFAQGIEAFAALDMTMTAHALAWLREAPDAVVEAAGNCGFATRLNDVEAALAKLEELELPGLDDNKLIAA